jgi:hypothetical protein
MSKLLQKIETLPWLTNPLAMECEVYPFLVTVTSWTKYEGPDEDWGADLFTRFHRDDGEDVEIAAELIAGRTVVKGKVGFIATVVGKDIEPLNKLCPTLHGAMKTAEEYAVQVCSRIPEPAATPAP